MASQEDGVLSKRRQALALNETEKFILKREEGLLLELISYYRAGRIEHDFLLGRIAEIAAGRHLLIEMRRELTQEITNG